MKMKELFYGLGLRPRAREYTFDIRQRDLPGMGTVDFAQWRHPSALKRPTEFDESEIAGLRQWIAPGDVAIDIGAHSGDSTVPLALAAGPDGLVLAFEPNPYAFRILAANAGLNRRATNIHPHMFAATDSDGTFTFEYSDAGYCNGGRHLGIGRWTHSHFFPLNVEGRNVARLMDSCYQDRVGRVRFIKIDTEGYDHVVFRSLAPIIAASRPVLRTEIYKHMPLPARREYLEDLVRHGYDIFRMAHDGDYAGTALTPADAGRWAHFDVLAVPR